MEGLFRDSAVMVMVGGVGRVGGQGGGSEGGGAGGCRGIGKIWASVRVDRVLVEGLFRV